MECNVSDKLYIDRTAAIMTAMNYDGNGNAQDASQDIASALSAIPAADVRPVVRGRWIDNGIPESILSGCSVCGYTCGSSSMNFCPNCGADMREVDDG